MFSVRIKPEVLASLRKQYPEGCVVELVEMHDPYRDMPAGMTGKAIHVAWSNGTSLAVFHSIDRIRRID